MKKNKQSTAAIILALMTPAVIMLGQSKYREPASLVITPSESSIRTELTDTLTLLSPEATVFTLPETSETTAPETVAPETVASETTAPEPYVPETVEPETVVPGTTVPETTVPETTALETSEPETAAPETDELAVTVYWVADGKVYHTTPDCPSLSRSKNISSGSISDALELGKERYCKRCG